MSTQTTTKRDLCRIIAQQTDLTQMEAKEIIQIFLDQVVEELASGNRLELRNFGVFEPRIQSARKARNPRTNEVVHVDSKAVVAFKAGKEMGEKVQKALPVLKQNMKQDPDT